MESFFSALLEPGAWTQTQWLAVFIMLFVVVAIAFFAWRLYRIISGLGKSSYKPNIGLHRTGHRLGRVERPGEDDDRRD